MSITIRDCLNLPSLSLGKVIAGHDGLDRIVTTVSVLEFNDTEETDILSPNELLISSLFCVKDDVDAQCKLLEKAIRSGDVGLVLFYADLILGPISPKILKLADLRHFPIILMPESDMGLKYSDVISDVTEAIYNDRKVNHYFVRDTIQRLSQSPSQDRTPAMVLTLASIYAKSAFFLCDSRNNLIASSYWPAANCLPFDQVLRAYNKTAAPADSFGYQVYKTSFVDKQGAELTLYAATSNSRLNASILSEVAEVIQLFALLWNYNLNLQTPEALIPALLEGERDLAACICKHCGLELAAYNQLIFIQCPQEPLTVEKAGALLAHIKDLFAGASCSAIIDLFGSAVTIIAGCGRGVKHQILLEELERLLASSAPALIRTTYHSSCLQEDAAAFFSAHCRALDAAMRIYPSKTSFTGSDISFAGKVLDIITSIDGQARYYTDLLMPITENPESDLISTLIAYLLDCDSEVKKTAELLFVHRNTILYRLNKVRELLDCDLSKMPMAYDIYLAAAIYRMKNEGVF